MPHANQDAERHVLAGGESKSLARPEVTRVFIRSIVVGVLACVAFSFGEYMVAPGGKYTFYGLEARSFNPATYRWFFRDLFGIETAAIMGLFSGFFWAVLVVPVAVVLAALLSFVKPFASAGRAWIGLKWRWIIASLILACFLGLWKTIQAGVNPGVCC